MMNYPCRRCGGGRRMKLVMFLTVASLFASMESNRRNSIILLSSMIIIANTLPSISSFTTPPPLLHYTNINRRPSYRGGIQIIQRIATSRNNDLEQTTQQQQQLNAISYLNSLADITSNPQLFPTTSAYIKRLSQVQNQQYQQLGLEDAVAAPSAEEFLTQLSNELLRASQQQQQQNDMKDSVIHYQQKQQQKLDVSPVASLSSSTFTFPGSSVHSKQSTSSDDDDDGNNNDSTKTFAYNTNNNMVETILPPVISAMVVGGAALNYNPSRYTQINMASAGTTTTAGDSDMGSSTYGIQDEMNSFVSTSSSSSSSSSHPVEVGGGSNALRDLASSIPTLDDTSSSSLVDDVNTNLGLQQQDIAPASTVDFGSIYYDSSSSHEQVGNVLTSHISSSSTEGGGGILRELASSIPITDEQPNLHSTQVDYMGYTSTDNIVTPSSMEGALQDNVVVTDITGGGGGLSDVYNSAVVAVEESTTPDVATMTITASPIIDGSPTPIDQAPSTLPEVHNNDLSTQLSDLSYDGMHYFDPLPSSSNSAADMIKNKLEELKLPQYHFELPTRTTASTSFENALSSIKSASESSKRGWENAFGSMSHTFDGLQDRVADVSNSYEGLSKQVGNALHTGSSKVVELRESNFMSKLELPTLELPNVNLPHLENTALPKVNFATLPEAHLPGFSKLDVSPPNLPSMNDIHPPAMPNLHITEATSTAVQRVGDASLSDFANSIVSAIQFTGGILIKFVDLILGVVAGSSVSSILSTVHSSVSSVIDNASHTVISTLTNIGNMSIIEIIQHLLALVVATTDIMLKIMNAIIYIISGKDGFEWALQATTSMDEATSRLLAQATSTYDDVTHTSLIQLAQNVGEYSEHVGHEFVTLIGSLHGVDLLSNDITIPEDTLDGIITAVQTTLSM